MESPRGTSRGVGESAPSPELVVRTDPTPAEIACLEDRLYEFNAKATGIDDALNLAIFVRDDLGEVVAGLSGHTWGGCCEITQLWVHEKVRGLGTGRRLLELAERGAAMGLLSNDGRHA